LEVGKTLSYLWVEVTVLSTAMASKTSYLLCLKGIIGHNTE